MDTTTMIADLPIDLTKRSKTESDNSKIGPLPNSLDKHVRWMWATVGICGMPGGLAILLLNRLDGPISGPEASAFALVLLAIGVVLLTFAGIALIAAPIVTLMGRSCRRQLTRIESGQYVALWRYSDKQWQRFIDDEHDESNAFIWLTMIGTGVAGLLFGMPLIPTIGVTAWLLLSACAVSVGYPLGLLIRQFRRNKLKRWSNQPWIAIIGHEGLYYAEHYFPFSSFGSGLESWQLVSKDEMLYLVFKFYNQTQNGRSYTDHRIPVPWGKEQEARDIVDDE